ncbi:MAG: D-amino acid dehydrogenase [Casimicrobiaceae bacterium]|nr:D-amino acid dehydrogenase [Casimicrobiaceae bacterium]MDW8312064.1 D-amino acid dehydrogenase [Burkholderiales bacterium]
MKRVVILGAGILGVHTAYFIRCYGHEVTVIEREAGPALQTSFANGGQISVSQSAPWASPSTPLKVLRWLGQEDAPLLFRLKADPREWRWCLRFLYECLPHRYERNTLLALRLAAYSRRTLQTLRRETGIAYDHAEAGILMIHTSRKSFERAARAAQLLQRHGERREVLSVDEAVRLEPALAHTAPRLAGAIYAPDDETGDAYKFTVALAEHAARLGVSFRYGTEVTGLRVEDGRVRAVHLRTQAGRETLGADEVVVAMGSYSPFLLASVGVQALIYPAKGYSATLPIVNPEAAPQSSITDDEVKMVFTRLGSRLRVAGTAELNGYDRTLNRVRCEALVRRARHHFPEACDWNAAQFWAGLRPATPSNLPLIGRTRITNLWVNAGHGTLGWTQGPGSAKALADLIEGRTPEIDYAFLTGR